MSITRGGRVVVILGTMIDEPNDMNATSYDKNKIKEGYCVGCHDSDAFVL